MLRRMKTLLLNMPSSADNTIYPITLWKIQLTRCITSRPEDISFIGMHTSGASYLELGFCKESAVTLTFVYATALDDFW